MKKKKKCKKLQFRSLRFICTTGNQFIGITVAVAAKSAYNWRVQRNARGSQRRKRGFAQPTLLRVSRDLGMPVIIFENPFAYKKKIYSMNNSRTNTRFTPKLPFQTRFWSKITLITHFSYENFAENSVVWFFFFFFSNGYFTNKPGKPVV